MYESTVVGVYEKFRSRIRKIGLALIIVDAPEHPYHRFAVGPKKYDTKPKVREIIYHHQSACTQDKCPISLFSTLDEVAAFVAGFCVASKQESPL